MSVFKFELKLGVHLHFKLALVPFEVLNTLPSECMDSWIGMIMITLSVFLPGCREKIENFFTVFNAHGKIGLFQIDFSDYFW